MQYFHTGVLVRAESGGRVWLLMLLSGQPMICDQGYEMKLWNDAVKKIELAHLGLNYVMMQCKK